MTSPQRSILVTGAHGRLASAFLGWLKGTSHRAIPVTRNPREGEYDWKDLLEGDLLEAATDVVHFAWSTVPYSSEQAPAIEWRVDLPLLSSLLSRMAKQGVGAPRFVFLSSGGTVYGNVRGRPSREEDELLPRGWHGFAKMAAENLIRRFGQAGIDFTILRPSNIFGIPNHRTGRQGLIFHLLEAICADKPVEIWGDGSAVKDYLHVNDLVAAVAEMIIRPLQGTFNIAQGESHSVSEVIRIVEEITGKKAKIVYSPAPEWDVCKNRLSLDRILQQTNWRPTITLYQGIYSLIHGQTGSSSFAEVVV